MNQIWMGWFDNRRIPLSQKVKDAFEYHLKKYGMHPDIIELPLNERGDVGLDIVVTHDKYILPDCMFVGVQRIEEKAENEQRTPEN